jgi:VWFA-related protein
MLLRASARIGSGLVAAAALAASLAADGRQPLGSGQSIYVVAARDSRLFTLCVDSNEPGAAGGGYRETGSPVIVSPGPRGTERIAFLDGRGSLFLPAPAGASARGGVGTTLEQVDLDRDSIAADIGLRDELAREIPRRTDFRLAESADSADLVLVAESLHVPLIAWNETAGSKMQWGGDLDANFRQAILAVAVPAAQYRQHPGDIRALAAASVWDGVATFERRPSILPASSTELLRQLARKKRLPGTPPVCSASGQPLTIEAVDPQTWRTQAARQAAGAAGGAGRAPGAQPIFRSDVTYVSVAVTVVDADGRPVVDLKASEFRLQEDGVDQAVDRLLPPAEPYDVAPLVDTSASMRLRVEDIQAALLEFVETLRPGDRVMPVSFNDRVTVHAEATSDRARLRIGIFQVGRGEGTRLYDALELVKTGRLDRATTRKAIVLFTDGVDTRSRLANADGVLASIEASHIPVYVVRYDAGGTVPLFGPAGRKPDIAPPGSLDSGPRYAEAAHYLQALAGGSGGGLYHATSAAGLAAMFAEIGRELNGQYTIWYYPSNQARDGVVRRIAVGVSRPGVRVARARGTYRASK